MTRCRWRVGDVGKALIPPPTSASTPDCDPMRLNSPNLSQEQRVVTGNFHAIPDRKNIHFSGHGFHRRNRQGEGS